MILSMSFCLYNKKNITRQLEDRNFIFSGSGGHVSPGNFLKLEMKFPAFPGAEFVNREDLQMQALSIFYDTFANVPLLPLLCLHNYIQLFRERLSKKVHSTIPKGIVDGFEFTVLQRNLREWHERPWIHVSEG